MRREIEFRSKNEHRETQAVRLAFEYVYSPTECRAIEIQQLNGTPHPPA